MHCQLARHMQKQKPHVIFTMHFDKNLPCMLHFLCKRVIFLKITIQNVKINNQSYQIESIKQRI